jgi:hypothetical protein
VAFGEQPEEIIGATRVRVLETVVLHATDAIFWLNGTTAESEDKMRRIERPLLIEFTERPGDLKFLNAAGRTAFWRDRDGAVINGVATEAQRSRPAIGPFTVAGVVHDAERRYNPRAFSLSIGSAQGHAVVLYPSPAGTEWPAAGGLKGALRVAGTGRPLPWAVLELEVELSSTDTMTFRAQSSRTGDFSLVVPRLPPLPESVEAYEATLRVRADLDADAETPVNIDDLEPVEIESQTAANEFEDEIGLLVRPGEAQRVNSFGKTFLTVQAP